MYFIAKILVDMTNFEKKIKLKNVLYVLRGVLIGMYANFQVDTFEKDVFIAFETSQIATFDDIFMHYISSSYVCRFYTLFYAPIWVLRSFFELRTIK